MQTLIRVLHQLSQQSESNHCDRLAEVLAFACQQLGFPIAVIAQSNSSRDNNAHVLQALTPDHSLQAGAVLPLNSACCQAILQTDVPMVATTTIQPLPFALPDLTRGSYLAIRLLVDQQVYGLLVFIDPAARTQSFSSDDHDNDDCDVLRLLALWLGSEIGRSEAKAHNRLLSNSAGEGIYSLDADGRCDFINQAALELLGYRAEDLLGQPLHEQIQHSHADGRPYHLKDSPVFQHKSNPQNQAVRVNDEVMWRQDGTFFPVEYSASPLTRSGEMIGTVVVFRDVTESRAITKQLNYLANYDALTGLINRYSFERRLGEAMTRYASEGQPAVLCYLDLDQFKIVNDTCGHAAGDELLRQLSGLLREHCRQRDTLGRLGGDEFGILFENCRIDDAQLIASQMLRAINGFRFIWDQQSFSFGASAGLVALSTSTENVAAALSQADEACYLAKEQGRNRIRVYQADDAELAAHHNAMQWVSRLQAALAGDLFSLSAQSIQPAQQTDFSTGGHYYEILLRMQADDGVLIPPGAFMPAAERYNLAPALDRWVLRATLDWLAQHDGVLDALELCTLNLSVTTLRDPTFLDFALAAFTDSPVPAHKIGFEIAETVAISNVAQSTAFMEALRERGCRFVLDQLGSGLASLGHLKTLPIDFVKIDGQFVRDLDDNPIDRALLESINKLAHLLGRKTIAFGVETPAALAILQDIGVDLVQGIGVMPPLPLNTLVVPAKDNKKAQKTAV